MAKTGSSPGRTATIAAPPLPQRAAAGMSAGDPHTTHLIFQALLAFAIAQTLIGPVLPEIAGEFDAGLGRIGILFTFNFLGFCTALSLSSCWSGRVPKSRLFCLSGLGLGIALLAFATAPGLPLACLAMFFIGGCGGNVESLGSAVLADLNPGRVGSALNLSQVFFGLGALAGPAGAGILLTAGLSWRLLYFTIGAVTLILFFPIARARFPEPVEAAFSLSALRMLFSDTWFLGVLLMMAAYVGVEIALGGWLSTFVQQTYAFSKASSSLAASLFWLAMSIGRMICSKLAKRMALDLLILFLAALSLVVTCLLCLPVPPLAVWLLIFLAGLGLSGLWPSILAYGVGKYTLHSAVTFNTIVAAGGLGGCSIPWLMGLIAEAQGFRSGLFLLAGLELLLLIVLVLLTSCQYFLARKPGHGRKNLAD